MNRISKQTFKDMLYTPNLIFYIEHVTPMNLIRKLFNMPLDMKSKHTRVGSELSELLEDLYFNELSYIHFSINRVWVEKREQE